MLITFDCETLPGDSPELMDTLLADATKEKQSVRAPSNYKDLAKINEYLDAKYAEIDSGMEEKRLKTSFDGMYGRIACIAWAVDDGPVQSTIATDSEYEAIDAFYAAVIEASQIKTYSSDVSYAVTFCGHNVAGFDLPFLKHRSIILGIKPPSALLKAMNAKPWDGCIADTMLMWSAEREKRTSLDRLCKALGIPGKDGFDGSMVADTWPDDPQKVIDYCKDDVERTRKIYKRLTWS
jgi:DNA polymerase elongation subunit (family B)